MANEHLAILKWHPDVATKVGLVMANYASLEMLMYMAYATFSEKTGDDCFASYYGWRSLHLREEMITKEAEGRLDPDLQQALRRLWKRFKAAANRRTEVAHCTFLAPNGAVQRLRLVGNKPKFEPLNDSVFERTFTQYRNLATDIETFLVFCAQTVDRFHEVMQTLPHSQLLDRPVAELEPKPDQKSLDRDELKASLFRLGLLHRLIPDPEHRVSIRMPVQQ